MLTMIKLIVILFENLRNIILDHGVDLGVISNWFCGYQTATASPIYKVLRSQALIMMSKDPVLCGPRFSRPSHTTISARYTSLFSHTIHMFSQGAEPSYRTSLVMKDSDVTAANLGGFVCPCPKLETSDSSTSTTQIQTQTMTAWALANRSTLAEPDRAPAVMADSLADIPNSHFHHLLETHLPPSKRTRSDRPRAWPPQLLVLLPLLTSVDTQWYNAPPPRPKPLIHRYKAPPPCSPAVPPALPSPRIRLGPIGSPTEGVHAHVAALLEGRKAGICVSNLEDIRIYRSVLRETGSPRRRSGGVLWSWGCML